METYFAPPRRTDRREFQNQLRDIGQSPVMDALLMASAGILVILNEDRQIVGLNQNFLKSLDVEGSDEILGLRLGESLGCVHAHEEPAGCGTTEYCSSCGAAIAMMAALESDREVQQTCALVSERDNVISDICLQVRAKPIFVDGRRWLLFFAQDVTQQQFWLNMDRVFFHDINNTLTALYGNVQLLEFATPDSPEVSGIRKAVERLINEIAVQKDFTRHREATTYVPSKTPVMLSQIRKELDDLISGHNAATGKAIEADWPGEDFLLKTDILLVSRILGNMVINALEATPKGGNIRVTVDLDPDHHIAWQVWNAAVIPPHIQKRIFQRYFSSKSGDGRGLGTYSMKLFGETYLNGKVWFHSGIDQGTVFTFSLPLSSRTPSH